MVTEGTEALKLVLLYEDAVKRARRAYAAAWTGFAVVTVPFVGVVAVLLGS
jgi:hypothetical protein